jgi:hypothetical protein
MFFSGGNNDGSQKTESSGKQDVYEYRLADEKLLCEKYGFEKSEDGVYPSFDNPTCLKLHLMFADIHTVPTWRSPV